MCSLFSADHSYMQFFGDDFLRLILLRFVFCYIVLILHRGFKVMAGFQGKVSAFLSRLLWLSLSLCLSACLSQSLSNHVFLSVFLSICLSVCLTVCLTVTLRASLSGTFLQTLPDLVMPLKGHSLSLHSCPATRSAPSESFVYYYDCRSNLAPKHACKHETHPPRVKERVLSQFKRLWFYMCWCKLCWQL